MTSSDEILKMVKALREFPSAVCDDIADRLETVAWEIGIYGQAKDQLFKRRDEIERLNIADDTAKEFQQGKLSALRYALHLLP